MKIINTFFLISFLLISLPSFGEVNSGLYLGLKVGVLSYNDESSNQAATFDLHTENNVSFLFGYNWGRFGLQGEYYSDKNDNEVVGSSGNVELETFGVYGIYRSAKPVYFLGKAGVVYSDAKFENSGNDEAAIGFGFGGGWRLSKSISVEGDLTFYDNDGNDVDYYSIGALMRF